MNIPEMLVANEEKIGQLYNSYALRFNEYSDFWERMAKEENGHAEIIRKCIIEIADGSLTLNEKRFNFQALKTYSDYLDKELKLSQDSRLSLIHALSTALYIEQSLIEARFFEAFEGGSENLKKLMALHRLNEKEHLERVRLLINTTRT